MAMGIMNELNTIVVATNLNGGSEAALAYASKLAGGYGARIVLAYGLDPVDYAVVDSVPGKLLSGLTEEARAALDTLSAGLLSEGIPSNSEIRQGAVAQMLVDVARQYQAGLIVIGTEGMRGAGPVIVGAVAEQLVRMSPCPVLAVAEDWNAGEFRPTPGGPVLLAMERNEATDAAVSMARTLAETFHRPLIVLHARGPAEASAFLNPCASTLKQFGVKESGRFPVRCIVKDGSPADVIVEAIAQYRPSLLVTGVKRNSSTPGAHGTAFTLLARSRVPVLCVPPSDAVEAEETRTLEMRT
jgi:nucleotide-binding universal stress UspA family protein